MFEKKTETPYALNDDELGSVVGGDDQAWDRDLNAAEGARDGDPGEQGRYPLEMHFVHKSGSDL